MMIHSIPPTYDCNSKILILGSFPSPASRAQAYFYSHPQNRFWKIMAAVFEEGCPATVEEKKAFLLKHKVALWDVISSCYIEGASDTSISHVAVNNLEYILESAPIEHIFVNGRKAETLYKKHIQPLTGIEAIYLPSTSPANAAWSFKNLLEEWKIIKKILLEQEK